MSTPVETVATGAAKSASSTLSQLLARILSQLALSAWLPSAALVLVTAYIANLGSILDAHNTAVLATRRGVSPPTLSSPDAVANAFEHLGNTGAAAIVFMIAAVIVLTMLTQAFTFESIRILEGYWVPWRPVERVAQVFCDYHRWRRRLVAKRINALLEEAWEVAKPLIEKEQKIQRPERAMTEEMIRALEVRVLGRGKRVELSAAEASSVRNYDWKQHAPAEHLRRLMNLDKRLANYPSDEGMKPTRLGNVLTHYEELAGEVDSVESSVDEVFDRLPPSLQISHDEQRGRIELYCSMVFVCAFVTGVSVLRLGWNEHRPYAIGAVVLGGFGAWIAYRAAVASAEYYGSLLMTIGTYREKLEELDKTAPVMASWWQRVLKLVP